MKYLDKTKSKKLNQLKQKQSDLHSERHMLAVKNAEVLKEYERIKNKPEGTFTGIFNTKAKIKKLDDQIEAVATKLVDIDNKLDELRPQIEAAALDVYQDYFSACESADAGFQTALKQLIDKNNKLREIFKEASELLDLNRLATTTPDYVRIDPLMNEVEDKKRFWDRMKRSVVNKLSTAEQNGMMDVYYETSPPKRAIFAGTVHRVTKEQAERDIAEGFAIPADEYEAQ